MAAPCVVAYNASPRRRPTRAGACTIPRYPALRRRNHVEARCSIHRRHAVDRRVGRAVRARCNGAVRAAETRQRSRTSLSNFLRDPDMTWLQQNFRRAKARDHRARDRQGRLHLRRLGRPRARGRARPEERQVGRARRSTRWRPRSVGFQAGISVSEGVTLVMTDKGFNSLLATSFKMGGDASVAAGPVGAGAKSDIVADLITFNRAKGVYGGAQLRRHRRHGGRRLEPGVLRQEGAAARHPGARRRQQQGRRQAARAK